MSREDTAGAPAASGLLARLSVQNWVHLILAGFVLVVCGCLVVGGIVMSRISDRTTDLVDRIQPARASSYQLQNSLLDQETGVRGFALTRDDTFLEPYDAGRRAEGIMLARVRVLVGDEQPFAGDLDRIEEASQEWRTVRAEPLIAAVRGFALGAFCFLGGIARSVGRLGKGVAGSVSPSWMRRPSTTVAATRS